MANGYPSSGGPTAGDFDGIGPSTISSISSGASMQRAAAAMAWGAPSADAAAAAVFGGHQLPWGQVGVGLVALVVALLYLDGRILS